MWVDVWGLGLEQMQVAGAVLTNIQQQDGNTQQHDLSGEEVEAGTRGGVRDGVQQIVPAA
jgi:hypothetical protein